MDASSGQPDTDYNALNTVGQILASGSLMTDTYVAAAAYVSARNYDAGCLSPLNVTFGGYSAVLPIISAISQSLQGTDSNARFAADKIENGFCVTILMPGNAKPTWLLVPAFDAGLEYKNRRGAFCAEVGIIVFATSVFLRGDRKTVESSADANIARSPITRAQAVKVGHQFVDAVEALWPHKDELN